MIDLLLLALLARPEEAYVPPPQIWYHQAVGCAGSILAEKEAKAEPTGKQFGEMMTWGMIIAETGTKAGRSRAQIDSGDVELAEAFYRRVRKDKPSAFAAHRAYCDFLLRADRP